MNKVAVVTGGSRGIGRAVAIKLGQNGFDVAIVATRAEENYPDSVKALKESGISYRWFIADIASASDRRRVVREIADEYGRIDVLVNNAGVAPKVRANILDMTEESFDYVVGTNTKGTMFMCQEAAKQMLKQEVNGKKRGTIINISSCSAEVVSVNRGEYCISKAGISMITKLFAAQLAESGIYVFEIRPGVINTDMTSTVRQKYDQLISDGLFPIARWGLPEDVANAVNLFAQDEILYSTGSCIDVDGGFHLRQL